MSNIKKTNAIKILLLIFILFVSNSCSDRNAIHKFSGQTMGTTYNITIYKPTITQNELILLKEKVEFSLRKINDKMNPFDVESEISKFNTHRSTTPFSISNEFYELITIAKEIFEKSNGIFDPTIVPLINYYGFGTTEEKHTNITETQIDSLKKITGFNKILIGDHNLTKQNSHLQLNLSAIAKGWGVDKISQMLRQNGYENFIVEIGGEIFASGLNNKQKWKLGIDTPELNNLPGQKIQSVLSTTNKGVATSGDYRNFYIKNGKRFSHLINPRTFQPITHNLASVTIVAKNCTYADAIATTAIVLGEKSGIKFVESIPNTEGYFISRVNDEFIIKQTSGF
ncbi:MAG: FAD:protein FMN transferase [Candidatus Marinimicrobia bacterium]|nr:FAD:protein FMN transferase [Candidatus Neomarinimicrobiota bacterium]